MLDEVDITSMKNYRQILDNNCWVAIHPQLLDFKKYFNFGTLARNAILIHKSNNYDKNFFGSAAIKLPKLWF